MRRPHKMDYTIIRTTLSAQQLFYRKNFDFLNDAIEKDGQFGKEFVKIRSYCDSGILSSEDADKMVLIAFDKARKRIGAKLSQRAK